MSLGPEEISLNGERDAIARAEGGRWDPLTRVGHREVMPELRRTTGLRILFVTPMPPDPRGKGAIPVVQHALLTALTARHMVTVVTVAGPDPAELDALERLRAMGFEVYAVERTEPKGVERCKRGWRWASLWLRGVYPFRTIWFYAPRLQPIIGRLLADKSFDLIQVEDSAMGIYDYGRRVLALYTEYEVRRPRALNGRALANLKSAWSEADWQRWHSYQTRIWRQFDCVQVFTRRDADSIERMAPDVGTRLRVNPFGIAIPPEPDLNREESGALLFIGDYTHAPNVDAARWLGLEIMPRLRERDTKVRLVLVGKAPPATVRELRCDDIVVTGQVPEIEPYLERAAVVIAPVRIGGGQRIKVLQGMAHGKAVVATTRGAEGLREVGGEPPLAIADDAEQIADVTAQLLTCDGIRHALGARARAFVMEHYSATAYAQRLEAIYDELLSREGGGARVQGLVSAG